jgi:molybdate transport system ATP-binding protein
MIVLDFNLRQGQFQLELHEKLTARISAIFGPSGAGKTTVLDAIAGLRQPGAGEVTIGPRVVFSSARRINLPPHERHVGYVTQDVALFPHLDVRRNIEYGRRRGQQLELQTVTRMLEIEALLERGVTKLSGGERQRVALARALMSSPELLLLDEPLTAVDFELRRRILPYLERVRDDLGVPIIYVTHDGEELRHLAEHVIVLDQGRVLRSGEPSQVLGQVR